VVVAVVIVVVSLRCSRRPSGGSYQ